MRRGIILAALLIASLTAWFLLSLDVAAPTTAEFPALPNLNNESALLQGAMTEADSAARATPNDANAVGHLAMTYHANRYYSQAETLYGLAQRQDPKDYRWPFLRALVLAEQANQSELIPLLDLAVKLNPKSNVVRLKLAEVAMKQDQLDRAKSVYAQLLKENPNAPSARIGLAQIASRQEDWAELLRLLDLFVHAPPKYRIVHQLLAQAYLANGMDENAATQEKILARIPLIDTIDLSDSLIDSLDELCYKRDMLLKTIDLASRQKKYDKMYRMAARAVRVAPEDADIHHALSRALILARPNDSKAFAEAMKEHERGLELRPDDLQPVKYFCQALFEQKRFAIIAPLLEKYVNAFPEDATSYNNLGFALKQIGQTDKAIHYLSQAIAFQPDDFQLRQNLGIALIASGKIPEAIELYHDGLEIGFDVRIANDLAWILATHPESEIRDGKVAIQLAQKACDQTNNLDYRLLNTLATAYAEEGQYPQAIDTAQHAIELALQAGQSQDASAIETCLTKYKSGQPHHSDPAH